MTFEEWYNENFGIGKVPAKFVGSTLTKEFYNFVKEAWQAGYDEGYEQGVEEVMSK